MKKIKCLLIKTNEKVQVIEIPNELSQLQSLVNGNIEGIFTSKGVHCYVNEDGIYKNMIPNTLATRFLLVHLGRMPMTKAGLILGPMIVLGDGKEGDEESVPEWVIDEVRSMCKKETNN